LISAMPTVFIFLPPEVIMVTVGIIPSFPMLVKSHPGESGPSLGSGTIEVELTWVERFMTQREEGNVQD